MGSRSRQRSQRPDRYCRLLHLAVTLRPGHEYWFWKQSEYFRFRAGLTCYALFGHDGAVHHSTKGNVTKLIQPGKVTDLKWCDSYRVNQLAGWVTTHRKRTKAGVSTTHHAGLWPHTNCDRVVQT